MTAVATEAPLTQRTIGEIAATLPGATAVFRAYRLDFCCGGDAPLADAAARRGVDAAEVAEQLARLDPAAESPHPDDTAALVEHILTRFHETHRRELPELIRLARKVEAVHREHPQAPAGLSDALVALEADLEEHMQKEEQVLFPLMQQAPGRPLHHPLAVMRDEHERQREYLQELEAITGGFLPPAGACRSWQALYVGTAKLAGDIMEHVHLENNVLFRRFE
jgi:regulator of cell morphogenesis and NO signaling